MPKKELEVNASSSVCRMCGIAYGKLSGYFYKSYAQMWKGNGYLPICKDCLDKIFEKYMSECSDAKTACRAVCRKLDIYWCDDVYEQVIRRGSSRTPLAGYISSVNAYKYAGKSYDDTLRENNTLFEFNFNTQSDTVSVEAIDGQEMTQEIVVDDNIRHRWGAGYSDRMYIELEDRLNYWFKRLEEDGVDTSGIGIQGLLMQIVPTELEINRGRAAGEDVDKKVNTLNTLLGSAMLKPNQRKATEQDTGLENTPLGVMGWIIEGKRPIAEPDEEFQDVNKIKKYVHTWVYGHLAKMVGLKNSYTKLYEEEMDRLRVDKPEYTDDDELISNYFSGDDAE